MLEFNEIGKNMMNARRSLRMTKWKLSKLSGVAETTITNLEAGRSLGNITTIVSLADALGMSIDEYIGRVVQKYPKYVSTADGYIGTFRYIKHEDFPEYRDFPVYLFPGGERIADNWEIDHGSDDRAEIEAFAAERTG